ncbi:MAG: maleylpyruvate isomerase [Nocardioides sp.]|nr:maleylpyruvate isomerase [Nocardioides sp.]
MNLTLPLEQARPCFAGTVAGFLRAVDDVGEYDLLAASRCPGWSRLDVVVHVLHGWQEMLGGLVSQVDAEPTQDAASFWPAFASAYDEDPVPTLMAQRRRTAAYARPASALEQLHDVAAALLRGVAGCPDRPVTWIGQVFTAGDFLAVWAVENVVHHLDLDVEVPPTESGLLLTRATVEALARGPVPASWSDVDTVLHGTGRSTDPPAEAAALGLPVLG